MTKNEAIKEAARLGRDCYLSENIHIDNGHVELHTFSVRVDEVSASAEPSWEECFKIIRNKDPEAAKQARISKLKAELAKLEGEAA